jgi:hypothetical protein
MTKIEDITGAYGLNELKKIIKSIETFDNGEWLPAGITASVLEFLGASVEADVKNNQSGFCHSDEIVNAVCRKLEKEGKTAYKDISSYLLSSPRPNAFELMKNAEKGPIIDTWIQDTVQSDLGGHYDIEQRITETNFGMFKVQCLWTYNRAPVSIGGDSSWQNSGYRIVVA